jgi:hypothetical protein
MSNHGFDVFLALCTETMQRFGELMQQWEQSPHCLFLEHSWQPGQLPVRGLPEGMLEVDGSSSVEDTLGTSGFG